MKRLLIALSFFCAVLAARAQGLEDQYVQIYSKIQQADSLVSQGQDGQAGVLYQEALSGLNRLKASNPTWNPQVISFRLNYVNGKLAGLRHEAAPANINAEPQPTADPAELAKRAQALAERVRVLEAGNAELSAKLKEALSVQPAAGDPAELKKARDTAQTLSKENDTLKAALEQTKAALEAASKTGTKDKSKKEISSLEERLAAANSKIDDLKKQIADLRAENKASGKKNLAVEVETLRAQLKVYEAKAVPFTAEELALVSAGSPMVPPAEASPGTPAPAGAAKPAKRPHHELPPGAGPLMADALRDFHSGRAEPALAKFLQVLSQGEDNLTVLYYVATCQIQLKHPDEAEKNVQRALALDPDDEPVLELLGRLRYEANKYDEAFAALSRAVALDPKDAPAENMLGATLAQKGDRAAAETAFRTAIAILPEYADAHFNLAVIYANQTPPFLHLARREYQKALAYGHPADEKLAQLVGP